MQNIIWPDIPSKPTLFEQQKKQRYGSLFLCFSAGLGWNIIVKELPMGLQQPNDAAAKYISSAV